MWKSYSARESCWYPWANTNFRSFEKFANGYLFEAAKRKAFTLTHFFPLIAVQYVFGRNFTQFENSTEKMKHFVSVVWPVFGPLNISRPFRQLVKPGPRCKPLANKMWSRWLSQQAKWHFAGKWYFPNQISPVSLFEYVLNRQLHVWEKPSDKEKKTKKNLFPVHFSERW